MGETKCCICGTNEYVMKRKHDDNCYCRRHNNQIVKFGRIIDDDRTVYGVGINDVKGFCRSKSSPLFNLENERKYHLWKSMFKRCYGGYHKSYEECEVCDRWHRLSNFLEDLEYIDGYELWVNGGYHEYCLDKDIKVNGNKIYSLENCCFVTKSENSKECCSRIDIWSIRKVKLIATNIIDGTVIEFDSYKDANKYGFTNHSINRNIAGITDNYKGYIWKNNKTEELNNG